MTGWRGARRAGLAAAGALVAAGALWVALVRGTSAEPESRARPAVASVPALRETTPVPHDGDAADDPAIWVDRAHPARSVVIGTDKKGGVAVYDVTGRQLQYRPDGRLNNVDLRQGFRLGRATVTLVAASDRGRDTLALYRLDRSTRRLVPLASRPFRFSFEPYGLCMYRSPASGRAYVFVTSEDGRVEEWRLSAPSGRLVASRVRSFAVGSQSEGCVADDRAQRLYVAEEDVGIWRYGAEPGAGTARVRVDTTGRGGHVAADVEGLALAAGPGGGFLVASSQGDSTFAVYERTGANRYRGSFAVGASGRVDAVGDTDGIDVTSAALGPSFAEGLLVVQDGRNEGRQNFKLLGWGAVVAALRLSARPAAGG
jgi:3-phytase